MSFLTAKKLHFLTATFLHFIIAADILLESLLEGYAEYYSAELSQKIQRGHHENALKGRNNGGGVPLGYVLGDEQKLELDPLTAPLVVELFTRYAEGETMRTIVESFNERGLKTRRGRPFNMSSFHAMLKNRKYIGEYKYQDVVIPGGVPAVVSEELFDRVQERMAKNKRAPAHTKSDVEFLLTTKLFCGKCEKFMVGESGTSHTGAIHYYYKCGSAKRRKGCRKKAVKKDWIERIAVNWTVNKVLRDEEIENIVNQLMALQEREDPLIPSLRSQLAETDKAIENLLDAVQKGLLNKSAKKRLDDLESQKEQLELSILQAELQRPKYTHEQMTHYIEQFKYGDVDDVDYQRKIIDVFVNAIYLFDDKIVFIYNYKDGTETVSLKEVEAVLGSDLMGSAPPTK